MINNDIRNENILHILNYLIDPPDESTHEEDKSILKWKIDKNKELIIIEIKIDESNIYINIRGKLFEIDMDVEIREYYFDPNNKDKIYELSNLLEIDSKIIDFINSLLDE